jgi:hypothetical protein
MAAMQYDKKAAGSGAYGMADDGLNEQPFTVSCVRDRHARLAGLMSADHSWLVA